MRWCELEGCTEKTLQPGDKYCSDKHRRRANYLTMKAKGYWTKRYREKVMQWKMSPNGRVTGIPIRVWLTLPKSWQ